MRTKYKLREGVRITATFRDPDSQEKTDPDGAVRIRVKPPGEEAVRELAPVTRKAEGVFFADVVVDVAGTWTWRAESAPPGPGVDEGRFEVAATPFPA